MGFDLVFPGSSQCFDIKLFGHGEKALFVCSSSFIRPLLLDFLAQRVFFNSLKE